MRNFLLNMSRILLDSTGKITDLSGVATGISGLVKNIIAPILSVIGVVSVIYAIYLGVMYAKAESADKRKEVQGRLVGAVIGAVIIVVGATLCFALDWASIFEGLSITETPAE